MKGGCCTFKNHEKPLVLGGFGADSLAGFGAAVGVLGGGGATKFLFLNATPT